MTYELMGKIFTGVCSFTGAMIIMQHLIGWYLKVFGLHNEFFRFVANRWKMKRRNYEK